MEVGLCPYDAGLASLLVAALRQDPQRDPVDPALNDLAFGLGKFLHGEVENLWTAQERTIASLAGRVEKRLVPASTKAYEYALQVVDWLGERLSRIQTVDDLVALFHEETVEALESASSGPSDVTLSVLGMHLRRLRALFGLLPFEGTCKLLEELQAEFAAAAAGIQDESMMGSSGLGLVTSGSAAATTTLLIQRARQVRLRYDRGMLGPALNANGPDGREYRDRMPSLDKNSLEDVPAAALLRHETAVIEGDLPAAGDTLRRYHDRSMSQRVHRRVPNDNAARALPSSSTAALSAAELAVAQLHARLGQPQRAKRAADEVVRIAQSSGSRRLLARALAALDNCTSDEEVSHVQKSLSLDAMLRRAVELGDAELAAMARLGQGQERARVCNQRLSDHYGSAAAFDAATDVARLAAWAWLEAVVPSDDDNARDGAFPPKPDAPQRVTAPGAVTEMFASTGSVLRQTSQSEETHHEDFDASLLPGCADRAGTLCALAAAGNLLWADVLEKAGAPGLAQIHLLRCLRSGKYDTISLTNTILPAEFRHEVLARLALSRAKQSGPEAGLAVLAVAEESTTGCDFAQRSLALERIAGPCVYHTPILAAWEAELRAEAAALEGDVSSVLSWVQRLRDLGQTLVHRPDLASRPLQSAMRCEVLARIEELNAAEAHSLADKAHAKALQSGDRACSAHMALLAAKARYEAGDTSGAIPETLAAIAAADGIGETACRAEGRLLLARLLCHVGEPNTAHRIVLQELAVAQRADWQCLVAEAWLIQAECLLLDLKGDAPLISNISHKAIKGLLKRAMETFESYGAAASQRHVGTILATLP